MADGPKNMAASVKARLLAMSREEGRAFDLLLVRYALERLLFRLSISPHRENYILKGGMLVTQWLEHSNRETRDIDFLGFGADDEEAIKAIFAEIMSTQTGDGLVFDIEDLAASTIRDEMEYGGIRLKTSPPASWSTNRWSSAMLSGMLTSPMRSLPSVAQVGMPVKA